VAIVKAGGGSVAEQKLQDDFHIAYFQHGEWPGFVVTTDPAGKTFDLDAIYPSLVPDTWVVLSGPGGTVLRKLTGVRDTARSAFALSARVTELTLSASMGSLAGKTPREVSVLAGSERLEPAGTPTTTPVEGAVVDLAAAVTELPAGRAVVVSGRAPRLQVAAETLTLTTTSGAQQSVAAGEVFTVTGPSTPSADNRIWPVEGPAGTGSILAGPGEVTFPPATGEQPRLVEVALVGQAAATQVVFSPGLTSSYDRTSFRIAANAAAATHGETKQETLGSGNAQSTFQQFSLAQSPLTYVGSPSTGGIVSTLQVRVDGILWSQVSSLFGHGPDERIYTVRIADDDKVTVGFGDGVTGARLPTGTENITATYRVGTGLAGVVGADQLTLVMTRPLGVRGVTNPLPAGLAADPDQPAMVRRNAPRTALAFDRVVSLLDFEDFVRAIPGIAKAQAAWLWVNGARIVHLTVIGEQGATVGDADRAALLSAIHNAGDPRQPVAIDTAELLGFSVSLSLVVDPKRVPGSVSAAVREAMLDSFGFDARDLGQPVSPTEALAVAQRVPGVIAATLVSIDATTARSAWGNDSTVLPAQLLTVRPDGITVTEST
jgi:predicted phage baseplate assembly protein